MTNYLQMPESIANPVDRRGIFEERLNAFLGSKDRHSVKENRGRARQGHVRRNAMARFRRNSGYFDSDDRKLCPLFLQGGAQRLDMVRLHAVCDERSDFTPLEG